MNQRNQSFRTHAQLGGKGQSLGKTFVDEGNLQIHYQLGSLALAGFAHAKNLLAHGVEQWLNSFDDRLVSARDKNQPSIFRAHLRTCDRSIHVLRPASFHALREFPRGGRRDGAGINHDHALSQRFLGAL